MPYSFLRASARLGLAAIVIAALPLFANAQEVLYNYANPFAQDVVSSGTFRTTNNADIGTLGGNPTSFYSIDSVTIARNNGTTNGAFDLSVFIWGNVNPNAPAGTSIFSNLLAYGTPSTRTVTDATQGQSFFTTFNFTPGAFILQGGTTFGYQVVYAEVGTINTNTASYTPTSLGIGTVFSGNGGAGSSTAGFYGNDNGAGIVQASDFRTLPADQPRSNVYLAVIGTVVVPETSSVVLTTLGGVGLIGTVLRRRSRRI